MTLTVIKPHEPPSPLPEPRGVGNVLMLAGPVGTAKHIVFKVAAWDPSKHPKGAKGLFVETPDKKAATHTNPGDVLVTKNGKTFKVEKQTAKGVKVNPVDNVTGEVKSGYTVLGNDIEVGVVEAAKAVGTAHAVSELEPGTYIKTKAGKRFKISKHGKWTTVYPVDDKGEISGKHTVLPPATTVTVDAPAYAAEITPQLKTEVDKIGKVVANEQVSGFHSLKPGVKIVADDGEVFTVTTSITTSATSGAQYVWAENADGNSTKLPASLFTTQGWSVQAQTPKGPSDEDIDAQVADKVVAFLKTQIWGSPGNDYSDFSADFQSALELAAYDNATPGSASETGAHATAISGIDWVNAYAPFWDTDWKHDLAIFYNAAVEDAVAAKPDGVGDADVLADSKLKEQVAQAFAEYVVNDQYPQAGTLVGIPGTTLQVPAPGGASETAVADLVHGLMNTDLSALQVAAVCDDQGYWNAAYWGDHLVPELKPGIKFKLDQAMAEATQAATIKHGAQTVAQQVQEILPTKLPKVPKPYPPGAGEGTRVVMRRVGTRYVLYRETPSGATVHLETIETHSVTAARTVARKLAADHEEIVEQTVSFANSARLLRHEQPEYVMSPRGDIMKVINIKETALPSPTATVVARQADVVAVTIGPDGELVVGLIPRTLGLGSEVNGVWTGGTFVGLTAADVKDVATVAAGEVGYWAKELPDGHATSDLPGPYQPLKVGQRAAWDVMQARGALSKTEDVRRKARPERYSEYLQADWSIDQLMGATPNEALKVLNKLGYREIKPRLKDQVRVINAHGARLILHRDGQKITGVTQVEAPMLAIEGSARDTYEALKETLASGGDVASMAPDGPPEARTSLARNLVHDLAAGKQRGVAEKIGKSATKDIKVKTDAQYLTELEGEGVVKPVEGYLDDVDDPGYSVTSPRGASLVAFGMTDHPAYQGGGAFTTTQKLAPDEAAALSAILKRGGVAQLMTGTAHKSADEPIVTPPALLSESSDPVDAARKLAAEIRKNTGLKPSALDELDEATRAYVLQIFDKFEPLAHAAQQAREDEHRQRAENLRTQTVKDTIAARRKAEGTVPEPVAGGAFDLPVWDEIEFEPQTFADINQHVASIGDTPYDVPAFYSGGLVKDGVLQHRAEWTYGKVELEFDARVIDTLRAQGAIEEANRDPIDPGYNGTAKLYDGYQLTLTEGPMSAVGPKTDQEVLQAVTPEMVEQAVADAHPASAAVAQIVAAELYKGLNKDAADWEQAWGNYSDQEVKNRVRYLAEKTPASTGPNPSETTAREKVGTFYVMVGKLNTEAVAGMVDEVAAAVGPGASTQEWVSQAASVWHAKFGSALTTTSGLDVLRAAIESSVTAKRIEYVHHDQASWNTGGAPTSQRGALRLIGYTPEEAALKLQQLGILGDLEPEVPFKALLRSTRRHGLVAPIHPAYLRGEAEPPKIKARITHGVTNTKAGGAVESLKAILGSGGLQSIHERHRQGMLQATKGVSISGDIRSGIDHAVFCTFDSGGACGAGSQVKFVMKPSAYLRRDVAMAPTDFGGCDTRYSQYKTYLNGLQTQVGVPKTNLYAPVDPKVRQAHINGVSTTSSVEYNIGPSIPIEDMEAIGVPTQADVDSINALLDSMLASGKIASKPQVLLNAEANKLGDQGVDGTNPHLAQLAPGKLLTGKVGSGINTVTGVIETVDSIMGVVWIKSSGNSVPVDFDDITAVAG